MKRILLLSFMCLTACSLWAQHTITGTVKSKTADAFAERVTVAIKGSIRGTVADEKGHFSINVPALPITLIFSSVGFETQEVKVHTQNAGEISLVPAMSISESVIVSAATKKPIRLIESPVSIETYGSLQIRNSPSPDYYEFARYKNGVDITTSSLTFKTISTRGFNGSGSSRVNQIVDGMDNISPGLNFFVGNFAGITEPDVDRIEILPGASSALYGPGGMNGTVLISSKDPFKNQGLSILLKEGVNNIDKTQRSSASAFHDFSLRYAKAIKDRFAFKIGVQYIRGTDWLASDSSNYSRSGNVGHVIPGTRNTDPNYDGVNVYGDETSLNVRGVQVAPGQVIDLWGAVAAGIKNAVPQLGQFVDTIMNLTPSALKISRTGYQERYLLDPITKNIKLTGALHYKLSSRTEALLAGYWATGNSVYTGNNRYAFKDIIIGQYKLELRNPNWMLRSYTTQEDAGEAYTATVTAQRMNEAWKGSGTWYQQYAQAYLLPAAMAMAQAAQTRGWDAAKSDYLASIQSYHNLGRAAADQGRPVGGSPEFNRMVDSVRKVPVPKGGRFLEKSQLWMTEGQYNFSDFVKFADIIVGASWKRYILDSKGTLFIDDVKPITTNELGAYAQVTRKLFSDFLTLSFSGRYDKNEDFKGRFTPRATALLRVAKDNNLRFSYQTAYRFPTNQQKYIRLDVGDYTILGGLPWVMDHMNAKTNPVVELNANGMPVPGTYTYKELKPESMRSFEIGYKGWIQNKLLIDAYGYWGKYQDFLGRNTLFQPGTGKIFSTVVNGSTEVKTYGFGLSFDYSLANHYNVFLNTYSDVLTDVPANFQDYFNTPKYRVNLGVGNTGMGRKQAFGFNVIAHWQDAFTFDGDLATGPVSAFTTLDAQVNYKLEKINSVIKLGGTNILNQYYKNGYGNPEIGGLYYVSFGFNLSKK